MPEKKKSPLNGEKQSGCGCGCNCPEQKDAQAPQAAADKSKK